MNTFRMPIVLVCAAAFAVGCASTAAKRVEPATANNDVLALQEKHLDRLGVMIGQLRADIYDLKANGKIEDPTFQKIHDTDLAGLRVRQKQLLLLRKHCLFAREKLLQAQAHPEQKPEILKEWDAHLEEMREKLDALDAEEDRLERQRYRLELDMIRESFL